MSLAKLLSRLEVVRMSENPLPEMMPNPSPEPPSETMGAPEPSPPYARVSSSPSPMSTFLQFQLVPAVLAFALGLAVGYILWGLSGNRGPRQFAFPTASGAGAGAPAARPSLPTPTPGRLQVSVDDDPARGPEDAPVVMIEFSDYECPFCKKWRMEVYDPLFANYGDVIRFVYRDFPIQSIHPEAVPAAVAANCAGEQGKYWEYHDLLFLGGRELGRETYLAYAEELDLDMEAFQACLESEEQRQEVLDDFNDGVRLGVRGTPTFFINGLPVVGAQPFAVFQQVIEQELARASK